MKSPCPDVGISRCIRAVESIIDADNVPSLRAPFPYAGIKNNTHIVWVWL